jgi:hypothetical protein
LGAGNAETKQKFKSLEIEMKTKTNIENKKPPDIPKYGMKQ